MAPKGSKQGRWVNHNGSGIVRKDPAEGAPKEHVESVKKSAGLNYWEELGIAWLLTYTIAIRMSV